ncbi:MAG: DUF4269 domain-containing protein [Bacilli bacterium]
MIETETQRALKKMLATTGILQKLAPYSPIIVGTMPIGIDIASSDVDIVCCYGHDKKRFENDVQRWFGLYSHFKCVHRKEAVVMSFLADRFEVELFATAQPSTTTNGYRHMVVEARLLQLANAAFRTQIIQLKEQGMKTEPAFANMLALEGCPFEAMLELEYEDDVALCNRLRNRGWLNVKNSTSRTKKSRSGFTFIRSFESSELD